MIWSSIDPGKDGAIVYWQDANPIGMLQLRALDFIGVPIKKLLLQDTSLTICENVHGIVGDSASSAFTFGYVVGRIHQKVIDEGSDLLLCSPMRWMRKMHEGLPKGMPTKKRSLTVAVKLYEDFLLNSNVTGKSDDGVHDALLLGHFYWHHIRGKE